MVVMNAATPGGAPLWRINGGPWLRTGMWV